MNELLDLEVYNKYKNIESVIVSAAESSINNVLCFRQI